MTNEKPPWPVYLEYLRLVQTGWLRRHSQYGDGYNSAIIRLAVIGWAEHRPYDLSSIAANVNLSRQQVARRVVPLVKQDLVIAQRRRNRILIIPTDALIRSTADELDKFLPLARLRWEHMIGLIEATQDVQRGPQAAGKRNVR